MDLNGHIADIERRLHLIEAFLDAEIGKRQHLASAKGESGVGEVNPWYGRSLGIQVKPISVGPVMPEGTDGRAEDPATMARCVMGDKKIQAIVVTTKMIEVGVDVYYSRRYGELDEDFIRKLYVAMEECRLQELDGDRSV